MAPVTVMCYSNGHKRPYGEIASAMKDGIASYGDKVDSSTWLQYRDATVGVMYGWRYRSLLKKHNRFAYVDLGYWNRHLYWRVAANDWSPVKSMSRGMPSDRFDSLGVRILPEHGGDSVLVLGMSAKACADHGLSYMSWERKVCAQLLRQGATVMFRAKPKDRMARPIEGTSMVQFESLQSLFARSSMVVAHHSNGCVEAVAAGCAVHCVYGAASLRNVPLSEWKDPPKIAGREQFLYDVAYTQWTTEEMRSGEAWRHMREGVLR